ncbi:hypothetical protein MITS9509_02202 [Synechococcus sp. MIT S9509]|nr:hypothetical protein MITS9509_02202 [Synechococcus sp. MIT S9509]
MRKLFCCWTESFFASENNDLVPLNPQKRSGSTTEDLKMNAANMSSTPQVVVAERVNFFLLFRVLERADQQISTSIRVMCVNAYRLSASTARISTLRTVVKGLFVAGVCRQCSL